MEIWVAVLKELKTTAVDHLAIFCIFHRSLNTEFLQIHQRVFDSWHGTDALTPGSRYKTFCEHLMQTKIIQVVVLGFSGCFWIAFFHVNYTLIQWWSRVFTWNSWLLPNCSEFLKSMFRSHLGSSTRNALWRSNGFPRCLAATSLLRLSPNGWTLSANIWNIRRLNITVTYCPGAKDVWFRVHVGNLKIITSPVTPTTHRYIFYLAFLFVVFGRVIHPVGGIYWPYSAGNRACVCGPAERHRVCQMCSQLRPMIIVCSRSFLRTLRKRVTRRCVNTPHKPRD